MEVHPIQTIDHKGGKIGPMVSMAAYEVYCHVYGPQEALVTGSCRGGFSTRELIALLYARSFPKNEWVRRVKDAFDGMENA